METGKFGGRLPFDLGDSDEESANQSPTSQNGNQANAGELQTLARLTMSNPSSALDQNQIQATTLDPPSGSQFSSSGAAAADDNSAMAAMQHAGDNHGGSANAQASQPRVNAAARDIPPPAYVPPAANAGAVPANNCNAQMFHDIKFEDDFQLPFDDEFNCASPDLPRMYGTITEEQVERQLHTDDPNIRTIPGKVWDFHQSVRKFTAGVLGRHFEVKSKNIQQIDFLAKQLATIRCQLV